MLLLVSFSPSGVKFELLRLFPPLLGERLLGECFGGDLLGVGIPWAVVASGT